MGMSDYDLLPHQKEFIDTIHDMGLMPPGLQEYLSRDSAAEQYFACMTFALKLAHDHMRGRPYSSEGWPMAGICQDIVSMLLDPDRPTPELNPRTPSLAEVCQKILGLPNPTFKEVTAEDAEVHGKELNEDNLTAGIENLTGFVTFDSDDFKFVEPPADDDDVLRLGG